MKRLAIAILGIWLGWYEFQDDIATWLPSWGTASDVGHVWAQFLILAVVSSIVLAMVIGLEYKMLSECSISFWLR